MALTRVSTERFSDVEVAAREIAQRVEELKSLVSQSREEACANWVGDGCKEFMDLSIVIQQQMKDISDEFWDVYETLVDTEVAFMEADNGVASQFYEISG